MAKRHIEVTPEMEQPLAEEIVEETLEVNNVKLCLRDVNGYHFPNDTTINIEDFNNTQKLEQAIIEEYSKEPGDIQLQEIFLYDHSGLAIQTFPQSRWDSSFLGFAFTTREDGETDEEMDKRLQRNIKMFGDSVAGEIYSIHLVEEKTCKCCGHTTVESVSGFDFVFGSQVNTAQQIIDMFKQDGIEVEKGIKIRYV